MFAISTSASFSFTIRRISSGDFSPYSARPSATFSSTVRLLSSAEDWKTMPMWRRSSSSSSGGSWSMFLPSTIISPESGVRSATMCLRKTLLPQPEGPTRTNVLPFGTWRSTPRRTSWSPKLLRRSARLDVVRRLLWTFRSHHEPGHKIVADDDADEAGDDAGGDGAADALRAAARAQAAVDGDGRHDRAEEHAP